MAWKSAILLIVLLQIARITNADSEQRQCNREELSDEVENWLAKNYSAVVDQLMPLEETVDWTQIDFDVRSRIIPSFFNEFYLTIALKRDGQIEARAVAPNDESISDQLRSLKLKFPEKSSEELASRIKLRTWNASGAATIELRQFMFRLQHENLNASVDPDLICVDGTGYEMLTESTVTKNYAKVDCYDRPEPPLVRFAEDFRRLLLGFSQSDCELIESLRHENFLKARDLIRNGANLSAYTSDGDTAWAFGSMDSSTLKAMLEKEPSWSGKDNEIIWAAGVGAPEIVRILLEAGADPNTRDRWCDTALILAASHYDDLESLHTTPENYIAVVDELIAAGADLEAKDDRGYTAFLQAVDHGHEQIAQMLINAGADVDATNNEGETARTIAEHNKDSKMLTLLQGH